MYIKINTCCFIYYSKCLYVYKVVDNHVYKLFNILKNKDLEFYRQMFISGLKMNSYRHSILCAID